MNSNINLVSSRNDAIERERKALLFLRALAVVLLSSIALVSVLAFIITTQIPLSKIKEEQRATLSGIASSSKKLSSYYLVRDRLVNIDSLLKTRQNYKEQLNLIFSKLPEGLTVDSMNIEKNLLEIQVSGSSLVPINDAINSLVALGAQGRAIKNVKLDSLSLNTQAARYTVAFTAEVL